MRSRPTICHAVIHNKTNSKWCKCKTCDAFERTMWQEKQCTYKVTLRRADETIVAVEKQYYISVCTRECVRVRQRGCMDTSMCLRACSLTNPVCNASPCYLQPPLLHHIFQHYLINGSIFGKSYWTQTVCFYFLYIFWNISYSKKNLARYCHKCEKVSV